MRKSQARLASGPPASHDTWPADPSSRRPPEEPPPSTKPFAVGQVLGGAYEVTAVLGSGGMGVVYEAHDRALNRVVALKVPLVSAYADVLRREAQAMAAVRHPNLVTVFAVCRHEDTELLVMERLHGVSLDRRIAEHTERGEVIPVAAALDLLIAITDGLTAVHRAGIAHRDVKASNVMVCGSRVVLTDFGLVTAEFDLGEKKVLAGSADYMAPELILGRVQPGHGPLVDLYALGVLAFEILTGDVPFPADEVRDVLSRHLHEPAPDVRSFRAEVPAELAELVRDLMAKAPEDRPESSEVLLWQWTAMRSTISRSPGKQGLRVLIVDDDRDVGRILKRGLSWSHPRFSVDAVTDSESALAVLEKSPPDILVVDLEMPRINGIEVCMHVVSLPRDQQPLVVAMSGEASASDISVLRQLGITHFLSKTTGFVTRMCDVIDRLQRERAKSRRRGGDA